MPLCKMMTCILKTEWWTLRSTQHGYIYNINNLLRYSSVKRKSMIISVEKRKFVHGQYLSKLWRIITQNQFLNPLVSGTT